MVNDNRKSEFVSRLHEACLEAGLGGRGLGKRITDALAEQGIKISGPAVWKWLNGESIPDRSNILALSKWLNVREEWLEYGRGSKKIDGIPIDKSGHSGISDWDDRSPVNGDEVEIPYFKSIELAAGYGCNGGEDSGTVKLRFSRSELDRYGIQASDAMSFPVHGDSMSPVIPNNSTVTVSKGHTKIVDGGIYAIEQDDLLRIKILQRQPGGKIVIKSFNSVDYPDEIADEESVRIIGRVFNWSVMGW